MISVLAAGLAASACGSPAPAAAPPAHPATSAVTSPRSASSAVAAGVRDAVGTGTPVGTSTPAASRTPAVSGTGASGGAQAAKPLAGKTIGIDPGHNGRNRDDPSYINKQVWNGRAEEACDTTGTETDAGYTEARFNFNVAHYLWVDLHRDGAKVAWTRRSDNGVGPCVNRRAQILNRAHSNVAIDIHADGGPASGRGFTVLEPIADGPNDKVIGSSLKFGRDVRAALLKYTSMPESDYYGHDGLIRRDDLAGLNLATQPKILIETGNMRNATDARLLRTAWFQKRLARAFTAAIVTFLAKR
jgi:N-acetylmuramoyl-L-alanine amidase